jgi:hypothetical protein
MGRAGPFCGGDDVSRRVNAGHDGVDAGDGRIEPGTGPDIAGEVLDIAIAAAAAPAEGAHVRAGGQEAVDDDPAQGAGAAGDQNSVRHTLMNRIGARDVTTARPGSKACPGSR